jgi:hypothetical protein
VSFRFKHNKENIEIQDELEDLISSCNAPLSLDDLSNVQLSVVPRNATSTLRGQKLLPPFIKPVQYEKAQRVYREATMEEFDLNAADLGQFT